MIGFAYNTGRDINGVGFGGRKVGDMPPVGPCSTVMVDWRNDDDVSSATVMEDGAMPGAISALLAPTLAIGSGLLGVGASHGWWDELRQKAREVESELSGPYSGAVANTLFLLVMAYDDSTGRMFLRDDRVESGLAGSGATRAICKSQR